MPIKITRECELIEGKYEYTVKIQNDSENTIRDVTVSITSYFKATMTLDGDSTQKVALIEPGNLGSVLFFFIQKDSHIDGTIKSTVSYFDHNDEHHSCEIEPYVLYSYYDLLRPLEVSVDELEQFSQELFSHREEETVSRNPQIVFSEVRTLLYPDLLYVVDENEEVLERQFRGVIRLFGHGRYTGIKVAVRIAVSGSLDSDEAIVLIEVFAEDVAMIPMVLDGISRAAKGLRVI